jgi:hypothetical protein
MPETDPATKGTNGELLPKLFIDIRRGLKLEELAMQPWAQAIMTERARNFQADDPITACKPVGGPRLNYIPSPIKVVQNPGLTVMMHEEEHTFRQIYMDGRKLPEDPQPSTFGKVQCWSWILSGSTIRVGWTRSVTRTATSFTSLSVSTAAILDTSRFR